jgi:FAD synthetase
MRVHPIINWSYADIWEFLRSKELEKGAGVPYCNLYDYGYVCLT